MEENAFLSLDTDILWPFDKASKIAFWLDITSDSEVFGRLLEEGVLFVSTLLTANDGFLSLSSFLYLISNHR